MKLIRASLIVASIFASANLWSHDAKWEPSLAIPSSDQAVVQKEYDTQEGKCKVWVSESLRPGSPIIGDDSVVYPYSCYRPNHRYNCVDKIEDSGHTTSAVNATYSNKIVAKYKIVGGLPQFSSYKNPGNTAETDCGKLIVRHMKNISSN